MKDTLKRLRNLLRGCRDDMKIDPLEANATIYEFPDHIGKKFYILDWENCTIGITRRSKGDVTSEHFNLATLIALARKAGLNTKDQDILPNEWSKRDRIVIALTHVESLLNDKDIFGKGIMLELAFAKEGLKMAKEELDKSERK